MTDEQAREDHDGLIRAQAAMTPRTERLADGWLVNRLVVRHRELRWPGTPPTYGALLAYREESGAESNAVVEDGLVPA